MVPHVAQFLRAVALELAYPSVGETGTAEEDYAAASKKWDEAAQEWRRARTTWSMVGVLVLGAAALDVWNMNRYHKRRNG
jgi:type IV secretory pathway TrbF-like protein